VVTYYWGGIKDDAPLEAQPALAGDPVKRLR
jgi:hypothetical protein